MPAKVQLAARVLLKTANLKGVPQVRLCVTNAAAKKSWHRPVRDALKIARHFSAGIV
jgi:hypothetical protein